MAEKVYTIPIRKEWLKQSTVKRSNRSINYIREFLEKHTKAEVKISSKLNETIWNGVKPHGKLKVKVSIENGVAMARHPDEVAKAEKSKKEKKDDKKGETEKVSK